MMQGDDTDNALYNTVHGIQNEQCREGEGREKGKRTIRKKYGCKVVQEK